MKDDDIALEEALLEMFKSGFTLDELCEITRKSTYLTEEYKNDILTKIKRAYQIHCFKRYQKEELMRRLKKEKPPLPTQQEGK